MLIPAIDLIEGKLVSLEQGQKKVVELANPKEFANRFAKFSTIQLVDLDAALEKGNNLELVKEICRLAKCRVGGGIRSIEMATELVSAGAEKIIIGTKANKEFLGGLCKAIGKEKVIVALDSKKGKIAVKGWTQNTTKSPLDVAKELENYCSEFLYTSIEQEGLLKGSDIRMAKALLSATKNRISIAGGVTSVEEIKDLDKLGIDSVVGMAIYTGKINPEKAFVEMIDFEKSEELVPTILQEKDGTIISLVYSNKESLAKTLESGNVWRYSREKKKVIMKGTTSGNTQEILEVQTDCDKDSLLFAIKQNGDGGCHTGSYSCFGTKKAKNEFTLQRLFEKIESRKVGAPEGSYTAKLFADELLLKRKLLEEAAELALAQKKEEVIWEAADLIYFAFALMANKGVTIKDIENENERRDSENEKRKN